MAEIGAQIKKARQEIGMSRLAFAIAIGVTPSTVYRWEIGESEPSIVKVQSIAILTGKSMDFFIDGGAE